MAAQKSLLRSSSLTGVWLQSLAAVRPHFGIWQSLSRSMNCQVFTTLVLVLAYLLATVAKAADSTEQGFASAFARPPSELRILKIIHSWPNTPEAQDKIISKLLGQGFGGVVCNVSFDEYLESEAKWKTFARAVNAAKQAGMTLWLYDERGYPSGNAGGITLRGHPEWESRGLLGSEIESEGGLCTLALPPGQLMFAAALPVVDGKPTFTNQVDLSSQARDGKVSWLAPPGQWRLLAVTENRLYAGTHADGNLWAKMPYINLLMAEPTARFIEATHQAYANHLGNDLGRYFMGTFTDEPSLMSLFLQPMAYRPLPWSSNLAQKFMRRRGYRLDETVLASLFADNGRAGEKHRYDFWLTVGELVSANFFGQIQTWCREHHVPSGGHLLLEESMTGHVPLYGDFFRCVRRLDAPSIDCLTSLPPEVPWFIARLISSAAELEGRTIVMCETSDHAQHYRPPGDQRPRRVVSEAEIRGTCNRLIVSGVNCITSYYSFTDISDEQLRRLNEWIGRACALVKGGHQTADIALLCPTESLWTKFVPSRHWTREATAASRIEHIYRAAAESLFTSQRDFTVVDSRALTEAKASAGILAHGNLRWRVVVLPGTDTLPLAAWENLAVFVRQGGIVVALGTVPSNSETQFPSPRVAELSKEMFGEAGREPVSQVNASGGAGIYLPNGSEGLLPLVLRGALEPDLQVDEPRSPLRITHRHIAGRETYFVINDSAQAWSGRASFGATGSGERWDLATGQMAENLKSNVVWLNLDPYGAAGFRFTAMHPPKKRSLATGPLPGLVLRALPTVAPTAPHGAFVRGKVAADISAGDAQQPRWRATATLAKTQVDTHLFAQFHFPKATDLSEADCLVLDTWVPQGQKTPSQILAILHEEDGADFIASTGRSLAAPGRERSFVPVSRFELAGWSKHGTGRLNLKRISEIRVGWGGYFGVEDEKIVFSLAMPQIGTVGKGSDL